jgi:hypothetical protein
MVLGINIRTYNPATHTWAIKWLNALTGAWTDVVARPTAAERLRNHPLPRASL